MTEDFTRLSIVSGVNRVSSDVFLELNPVVLFVVVFTYFWF
jgi:hypothetical protein